MSRRSAPDKHRSHAYSMPNGSVPYLPQVSAMETHNTDYATVYPDQQYLHAAKQRATFIKTQDHTNETIENDGQMGIDLNDVPKSVDLCRAANPTNTANATYFDDFLTAEFYRTAVRPPKVVDDTTIPSNLAAMRAHVQLLVRAFRSIENATDNPGMVNPFRNCRHDSKMVECLCWGLVKACIYRSKSDEPLLTAYDLSKAKNAPGLDTFARRFDAMVIALSRSKTICKHLYDAPYVNTFVDDPFRAIRRVDANRELNKQKADVMSKGKRIKQEEDDQNGPTPIKRSRSTVSRGRTNTVDSEAPSLSTPPHNITTLHIGTGGFPYTPADPRMTRSTGSGRHPQAYAAPTVFSTSSSYSQAGSSPDSSEISIKRDPSPVPPPSYPKFGFNPRMTNLMNQDSGISRYRGAAYNGGYNGAAMPTAYQYSAYGNPFSQMQIRNSRQTAATPRGTPMLPQEVVADEEAGYAYRSSGSQEMHAFEQGAAHQSESGLFQGFTLY